jgi:NAD+ synthase
VPAGALGPVGPSHARARHHQAAERRARENQKDQDTPPPYEVLDPILNGLVEEEKSVDDLVAQGYERETVLRIWKLLYVAEYKRRQSPPGVKLGAAPSAATGATPSPTRSGPLDEPALSAP